MARPLKRVSAETSVDALHEIIEADGCVVVEHAAPTLVERARRELARHIDETPFGPGNFHGVFAKNVEGLVGKSEAAHALMIHDTVMALCERVLLPHCIRFQLNYTGIMHLEPGAKRQDLHRDGGIYPFRHPSPPTILATMWAGTDFTADNGATRLVPGSHRWEHERTARDHEVVAAAMPAGSLLFYTSGVLHGGGSNTATTRRTGISVQYSLGWLRQEENLHLAVPPELARTLPDRLARLIGYEFGGPFLGFVHGDDPHRLIEPPREGERVHSLPELNDASRALTRLRFGDVPAEPTPPEAALEAAGGDR
jgi:ectoine hydroxylase-related dioxygenase (phytanoyl-CoA dioxygenase family)